ncbi:alpha/beta fold hydrolase [Streptomyces sp. NPDC049813]|uniref:alpha/beta fold hydrolase n=1 Tax=Streptomyces sp. NPDC049813 TaxID=3365597 RepID=UPI00378A11C1
MSDAYAEQIRSLTVGGVPYTYRVLRQPEPRTEPVVAMGGVLEGMHNWTYLESTVLPKASLVTIDMPTLDPSSFRGESNSVGILCDGLEGVIDDLGAERVNLYGYSLGAAVTFQYAQRHPGKVARLLIGGVPEQMPRDALEQLRLSVERARAGDADGFAGLLSAALLCLDESHHVHRRDLSHEFMLRFLRNAVRTPGNIDRLEAGLTSHHRLTGGLSGVPTTVFTGEHDHLHTVDRQREFAATIDGSRFVTFPDCDHALPAQRPEAIRSLVASFLMEDEAGAAAPVAARTERSCSAPGPRAHR